MKYAEEVCVEKRKRGLERDLWVDGLLITGGPFAVVMQVIGFYFFAMTDKHLVSISVLRKTWITFFFHASIFDL